jgi:hypothetical protein
VEGDLGKQFEGEVDGAIDSSDPADLSAESVETRLCRSIKLADSCPRVDRSVGDDPAEAVKEARRIVVVAGLFVAALIVFALFPIVSLVSLGFLVLPAKLVMLTSEAGVPSCEIGVVVLLHGSIPVEGDCELA